MKVTATLRVMTDIDALRTAIVLAMERLCFASAEAFAPNIPDGETAIARVAFSGPTRGELAIAIPWIALRELAERMLPPEALESGLSLDDVIAELANIICGNVLPRIHGRAAIYTLSPPELAPATGPELARAVVHFDVGWVAATLHGEASCGS